MSIDTISASEVYNMHKDAALEYEMALVANLPDDQDIDGLPEIRTCVDFVEWEIDYSGYIDDPEIQHIITKTVDVKQAGILKPKMASKDIKVIGALARLEINNIFAKAAYDRNYEKWYDEAKNEMDARFK